MNAFWVTIRVHEDMDKESSEDGSGTADSEERPRLWWHPAGQGGAPYRVPGDIHGQAPEKSLEETSRACKTQVDKARKRAAELAASLSRRLQDKAASASFLHPKEPIIRYSPGVGLCAALHLLSLLAGWRLFTPWAGILATLLLAPLTYAWLHRRGGRALGAQSMRTTRSRLRRPRASSAVKKAPEGPQSAPDGPVAISPLGVTSAGDLASLFHRITGEQFSGPQVLITDEDGVSMFFIGARGGYKIVAVPGPGVVIKFSREGGMPSNENITGYFHSLPCEADIHAAELVRGMLRPKRAMQFIAGYTSAEWGGANWKRYRVDDKEVLLHTQRGKHGLTGKLHMGGCCIVTFDIGVDGILGNIRPPEGNVS